MAIVYSKDGRPTLGNSQCLNLILRTHLVWTERWLPLKILRSAQISYGLQKDTTHALSQLKPGKVYGHGSISSVHSTALPPLLFNTLLANIHIPKSFKESPIIHVHERKWKAMTDTVTYRSITRTTFNKMFEQLLKPHLEITCPTQYPRWTARWFSRRPATLNVIIEAYTAVKLSTYHLLRDAFDVVWQHVLLTLQSEITVFLPDSGTMDTPATFSQGVYQGSIISPCLYLFIDERIKELKLTNTRVSSKGKYCGALVLADDVVFCVLMIQKIFIPCHGSLRPSYPDGITPSTHLKAP